MYILLGITLALAIFFAWNLLFSILAILILRFLFAAGKDWSANLRAKTIFLLRVLPAISGLIFVFALLSPAYLIYEPKESNESVSFKLGFIALFSTIGVGVAIWRVCGTWIATNCLIKSWLNQSEPLQIEGFKVPAYRIEHKFPVVAVVGTIYPRLFIASQVIETLSDVELQATLQHEKGHLSSRDNLKRNLLDVCRSLLMPIRFGRDFDLLWSKNVETAADEFAAIKGGKRIALNLASALVKIARIVPKGATPTMPQGSFLIKESEGDIAWRVQHLVNLSDSDFDKPEKNSNSMISWLLIIVFFGAALFVIVDGDIYFHIHWLLEHFVSIF